MYQSKLSLRWDTKYLIFVFLCLSLVVLLFGQSAFADPLNRPSRGYENGPVVESLSIQSGQQRVVSVNVDSASSTAADSSLWEMYSQLEMLQEEVQQLRGVIESQRHQIESLTRKQKEHYIDLDHRIGLLNNGKGRIVSKNGSASDASSVDLERDGVVAVSSRSAEDNRKTLAVPTDVEKNHYNSAISMVRAKKLIESQNAFNAFLNDYPNSIYVPNVHYWLGEIYLALPIADYVTARIHFETVTTQYPQHSKASACLYKLGVLHYRQGETEKARTLFQQVINTYPDSSVADLAQKSLDKISAQ
ncbi:MAG: tol-pal system protein YbgF [Pseudomonadales bacterium]|nr:tol-pal system protein YbgF [Pseudomonadales bacterium]